MNNILLIGANLRAMFYVAKHLYEAGYVVDVVDFEPIPIEKSKYIHTYYRIQQDNNIEHLYEEIIRVLQHNTYQAVIPINDVGVLVCNTFYDNIQQYASIIIPGKESMAYAYNKYKLLQLSVECGFSDPHTLFIDSCSMLENRIKDISDGTIIAKSCSSKKVDNGTIKSYSVFKTDNKYDLLDRYTDNAEYPIMIQNCIIGEEIGYNFYAENGEVKTAYFDAFLRGNFGEECIARRTIPYNSALAHKLNNIIKRINWSGVGMFDIIVNQDQAYILELNGRFWASVDLSDRVEANIWEYYANYYLNKNYPHINPEYNEVTMINITAANKKILRDLINFHITKDTFILISDILKTLFCNDYFIQEHILEDNSFYRALLISYIRKIFSHAK